MQRNFNPSGSMEMFLKSVYNSYNFKNSIGYVDVCQPSNLEVIIRDFIIFFRSSKGYQIKKDSKLYNITDTRSGTFSKSLGDEEGCLFLTRGWWWGVQV